MVRSNTLQIEKEYKECKTNVERQALVLRWSDKLQYSPRKIIRLYLKNFDLTITDN